MTKKYQIDEGHAAILLAKSALLVAEVAGMQALNTERVMNGIAPAYSEGHFYQVSDDLRETLAALEIAEQAND